MGWDEPRRLRRAERTWAISALSRACGSTVCEDERGACDDDANGWGVANALADRQRASRTSRGGEVKTRRTDAAVNHVDIVVVDALFTFPRMQKVRDKTVLLQSFVTGLTPVQATSPHSASDFYCHSSPTPSRPSPRDACSPTARGTSPISVPVHFCSVRPLNHRNPHHDMP